MKVRFIVNPIAGGTHRVEEINAAVRKVFSDVEGIFEVKATGARGEAGRLAKDALERGYDVVYACGGDGTINEVASTIVNSRVRLGIVPAGSGNAFARALSIPFDVEGAVRLATGGRVRDIDVGAVSGRFFFSTAGIGIDAAASKTYAEWTGGGKRRGILPYIPIVLKEFFTYRVTPVMIKCDERYAKSYPLLLTVANTGEYGSGVVVAPWAEPDDGFFDVTVIEDHGFFRALSTIYKIMKGRINASPYFKHMKASRVELTRQGPGLLQVDGEAVEYDGAVAFTMLPKALKVLVV